MQQQLQHVFDVSELQQLGGMPPHLQSGLMPRSMPPPPAAARPQPPQPFYVPQPPAPLSKAEELPNPPRQQRVMSAPQKIPDRRPSTASASKPTVASPTKPVYRASPGCLAIMRLIAFFDHLPTVHQAERKAMNEWLDDYFLDTGSIKICMHHDTDSNVLKEFIFPAISLPIIFAHLMQMSMTELAFSLHALTEYLITQPTNPTTASVVGYHVEVGRINMYMAYSNGNKITLAGKAECRFVRIPTYAPDGQLLSATLKIDKLRLTLKHHSHSILRELVLANSKLDPTDLSQRLAPLPELLTGPYGFPDEALTIMGIAESIGALTTLMEVTGFHEDPIPVLHRFIDAAKDLPFAENSWTLHPVGTLPKMSSLDTARASRFTENGPSSAPLQADYRPVPLNGTQANQSPPPSPTHPDGSSKKRKDPPESEHTSPKVSPRLQRPKRGKSGML